MKNANNSCSAGSLAELHQTYCDEGLHFRNLSSRTIKWWRNTFRYFRKRTNANRLEDLTADVFRGFFLDGAIECKWSPDTRHSYYRCLHSFLNWCAKRKYLETNPLAEIDKPKLGKKLPKSISEDEARLVLETILNMRYSYRYEKYRNYAFIATLVFTGLRLSEALNLGTGDVDLQNDIVSVRHGKGNKERIVPIPLKLKSGLQRYLEERNRLKRECARFFTSLRDRPLTASGAGKIIKRLKRKTKIDFSAHKLRHTFATLLLQAGCDLFTLSELMGHSDIKTTAIYLSTTVARKKEQIMKHPLNGIF